MTERPGGAKPGRAGPGLFEERQNPIDAHSYNNDDIQLLFHFSSLLCVPEWLPCRRMALDASGRGTAYRSIPEQRRAPRLDASDVDSLVFLLPSCTVCIAAWQQSQWQPG